MNATLSPQLDIHHVQAIVRAMHDLAKSDGIHDAERVMLRGFYDACAQDVSALTSFDQLISGPFDLRDAAESFNTRELKLTLLQSCLLLAYADGQYTKGEQAKIAEFAKILSVPANEVKALEDAVGDQLMQQISRIQNVDALREVAAEIGKR